jgi:type IV secretion system protein VirB9
MSVLLMFLLTSLAAAQTAAPPKRATPAINPSVTGPTDAQIKELGTSIEKLKKQQAAVTDPAAPSGEVVPAGWKPTQVKLPADAKTASEISNAWLGSATPPIAGRDGRVMFVYGASLPIVVCAPMRVCVIELQPGEHITAEPAIGDSVRWDVSPRVSGREPEATTLVIVKPRAADLETNMVLSTDRRSYFLRLYSDKEKYTARVAFEYPDEPGAEWKKAVAMQRENAQVLEMEKTQIAPLAADIDDANFAYDIKAKNAARSFRPLRVFDLGGKTHIVMPATMQHRDAPVLLIHGNDGKDVQVNYRVLGDSYIVDRLFDRAVLVLGVGRYATRVEITRIEKKAQRGAPAGGGK